MLKNKDVICPFYTVHYIPYLLLTQVGMLNNLKFTKCK